HPAGQSKAGGAATTDAGTQAGNVGTGAPIRSDRGHAARPGYRAQPRGPRPARRPGGHALHRKALFGGDA
nr:hypothetical protein [Tanacetum cinerariifolium]